MNFFNYFGFLSYIYNISEIDDTLNDKGTLDSLFLLPDFLHKGMDLIYDTKSGSLTVSTGNYIMGFYIRCSKNWYGNNWSNEFYSSTLLNWLYWNTANCSFRAQKKFDHNYFANRPFDKTQSFWPWFFYVLRYFTSANCFTIYKYRQCSLSNSIVRASCSFY